jgi:hypothetical protein
LASKYAGDTGIAQHPAVIFADNFESGSLPGPWDEARNQKTGLNLARVPGGPVGKRSLRVEAHLGKDPGGGVTKWFQPTSTLHANALTMEASITDRWTKNPAVPRSRFRLLPATAGEPVGRELFVGDVWECNAWSTTRTVANHGATLCAR